MRKNRVELIIKLINENNIENQDELVKLLASNGIFITQATASRDIARLNIVKVKKDGKSCYAIIDNDVNTNEENLNELKRLIINCSVAQNQLFIKTEYDNSKKLESIINNMKFKEVVGIIHGDDSLLIITKNNIDALILSNKLYKLINNKKV